MQKHIYDLRFQADKIEWRIRAKRDIVLKFWNRYSSVNDKAFSMLDFGCGLGVLQKEFEEKYPKCKTHGIDVEKKAIEYAKEIGVNANVYDGKDIPFKDNFFDLVTAIDVLEHVKDDIHGLKEIKRVLKKDGLGIFIVPAHMELWSTRDIRLFHFRRYEDNELEQKCKDIGLTVLTTKNVDFVLYFMLLFMCKIAPQKKGVPDLKMDTAVTYPVINEMMFWFEMLETSFQMISTFPIGISKLVVVKK